MLLLNMGCIDVGIYMDVVECAIFIRQMDFVPMNGDDGQKWNIYIYYKNIIKMDLLFS